MGDRGQVVVISGEEEDDSKVYLYTHWSGHRLPEIVQSVMKANTNLLDDPAYFTGHLVRALAGQNDACGVMSVEQDYEADQQITINFGNNTICAMEYEPIAFADFFKIEKPTWASIRQKPVKVEEEIKF